jgi:hypothetical protein
MFLEDLFVRPVLIWALAGVVLAYWVLRNIPFIRSLSPKGAGLTGQV